MGTVKNGILTPPPGYASYWDHLRHWKRDFWKRERKAALRDIDERFDEEKITLCWEDEWWE